MKRRSKEEREAIAAQRAIARAEVMAVLTRYGAKPKAPDTHGYDFTLDTPLGVLRVSLHEPETDEALWIHSCFDDVPRALAAIGDHRAGSCVYGMNPFSGKWNFTSHVPFVAALQRAVFRGRAARAADAIAAAWCALGGVPVDALRECANNSVVETGEGPIAMLAREAITLRTQDGRWPPLTEEQIERFVAAAHEAERTVT